MSTKNIYEKLYLSKGEQDIYVDENAQVKLVRHQIDGIRQLYHHFYKKKPGVILNSPTGHGKKVQVVLFIAAVRAVLNKPVLILCQETQAQIWMHLFYTWTSICGDVCVEVSKFLKNKFIYINSKESLNTFYGREWGMMIVDSERPTKDLIQLRILAEYKIWVTSLDMKENLPEFTMIHNWLYPVNKFISKEFTPDSDNTEEKIMKLFQLDAYMKDIVIKGYRFSPFKESEFTIALEAEKVKTLPKVTKKNKDATGTKIKRTKRKPNDACVENSVLYKVTAEKIPKIVSHLGNNKIYPITHTSKQGKMDIEVLEKEHKADAEINKDLLDIDSSSQSLLPAITTDDEVNIKGIEDIKIDPKEIEQVHKNADSSINIINDDTNSESLLSTYINNDDINNLCEKDTTSKETVKKQCANESHSKTVIQEKGVTELVDRLDSKSTEKSNNNVLENKQNETITKIETKDVVKPLNTEDKLKKFEEMMLKKFKGSILDRMF